MKVDAGSVRANAPLVARIGATRRNAAQEQVRDHIQVLQFLARGEPRGQNRQG